MSTSQSFYKALSSKEKEVFDLYKSNSPYESQQCFAYYLNDSLRQRIPLNKKWETAARVLDRIVRKYTCEEDTLLYRATFEDFVEPFISRREYVYPAYMSTCTNPTAIQRHYSNAFKERIPVKLEVSCLKGTPMAPMEAKASSSVHETEMLLGRGSKFLIVSRRLIVDPSEISEIMSIFYAIEYRQLIEYKLKFLARV